MATVADFTRLGLGPQTHAYNVPGLSPIEFLYAVMNAQHQPMSIRIEAVSYTHLTLPTILLV